MKVLYLGISPFPLTSILEKNGCEVIEFDESIDVAYLKSHSIHFIVSYRCPHIIRQPVIDYVHGRIINLHISFLPFNRGADPNLWSFLEDTPKGVTIHYIDCGLDTGDIIAQERIEFFSETETLATTYNRLNHEIINLFRVQWPLIMSGQVQRMTQGGMTGSAHKLKDKTAFNFLLKKKGWDTPVSYLIGKGITNKSEL